MITRVAMLFRGWSRAQWMLRAAVVAGYLCALLAAAGIPGVGQPATPWLVVVVLAALGAAVLPDSSAGSLAGVLVLAYWAIAAIDHPVAALGPSAVVGAFGLVIAHLAAMLASYGPPGFTPDRGLVLLWLRRGTLILAPSVLVALAVRVAAAELDGRHWVWGVAALVVISLAAAVTLVLRSMKTG
ncbi:hypothetical protein OH802_11595 [Nocardioides sp. NBC_00850]|uniref:hypothetical protein n=1 Tax=Nocardioides sp. NBC_00850 TaxID=2976001 RepID=UPI002FC0E5A8|nr:hypothetical protein OH802_11595 [Nocardioides sp. NBC_00850]